MESMVVYLGSDHVIKTPDFDFRKNSLRVSTTLEDAKQQAHKKVGIRDCTLLRCSQGK